MEASSSLFRCVRAGAVAGAVATVAFAALHHLLISDIWFSLPFMLVAGVLCGMGVAWTFGLVRPAGSIGAWVRYNVLFVVAFVLLGAASVAVFEPMTTIAALLQAEGPPRELFGRAMPLTVGFTLAMAGLMSWHYGRNWRHFGAILLTCSLLVALLGLNVAVIGLVFFPSGSFYLVLELLGLILVLDVFYAAVFLLLERRHVTRRAGAEASRARAAA